MSECRWPKCGCAPSERCAEGSSSTDTGKPQRNAVSVSLQQLAQIIDNYLYHVAGERIGFCMVVSVAETAQYVSNCDRSDGRAMLESLLERWQANRADIPAHYNPDL